MSVVVRLDDADLYLAHQVALARQIQNVGVGRRDAHGASTRDGLRLHLEGALGEVAVAKWSGRYWNGALGNLGADDVGRLQVRCTPRDDGRLIIHDSDPDDRVFVLVTGVSPVLTLRGWMRARDAKRREWWRDPGTGRPAYFVPQNELRPMVRRGERGASPHKSEALPGPASSASGVGRKAISNGQDNHAPYGTNAAETQGFSHSRC